MLNKKLNITDNSEWLRAIEESTKIYSLQQINELEEETISFIRKVAKDYNNVCSGWVAGKDSIVLDSILKKSNISYTPIMWKGVNEYPEMVEWISKNKPSNLVEEVIEKFSLCFFEKHPEYLFCPNEEIRKKWISEKLRRYNKDIKKYGFDLFIIARRLKDGNYCGKKENHFVVKTKNGYSTFSPIAEWTHEQLLAYIKYNDISLPPVYNYKRGFLIGSIVCGDWTERATLGMSINDVWEELYEIDRSIVTNASKTLTSAKNFLKGKENDGNH